MRKKGKEHECVEKADTSTEAVVENAGDQSASPELHGKTDAGAALPDAQVDEGLAADSGPSASAHEGTAETATASDEPEAELAEPDWTLANPAVRAAVASALAAPVIMFADYDFSGFVAQPAIVELAEFYRQWPEANIDAGIIHVNRKFKDIDMNPMHVAVFKAALKLLDDDAKAKADATAVAEPTLTAAMLGRETAFKPESDSPLADVYAD